MRKNACAPALHNFSASAGSSEALHCDGATDLSASRTRDLDVDTSGCDLGVARVKPLQQWRRLHRLQRPVALRVVASPISTDWIVRVDGWDLPEQFPLLYTSLEAAQRAADGVLINHLPHDCWLQGCGAWVVITGPGPGQSALKRIM